MVYAKILDMIAHLLKDLTDFEYLQWYVLVLTPSRNHLERWLCYNLLHHYDPDNPLWDHTDGSMADKYHPYKWTGLLNKPSKSMLFCLRKSHIIDLPSPNQNVLWINSSFQMPKSRISGLHIFDQKIKYSHFFSNCNKEMPTFVQRFYNLLSKLLHKTNCIKVGISLSQFEKKCEYLIFWSKICDPDILLNTYSCITYRVIFSGFVG